VVVVIHLYIGTSLFGIKINVGAKLLPPIDMEMNSPEVHGSDSERSARIKMTFKNCTG